MSKMCGAYERILEERGYDKIGKCISGNCSGREKEATAKGQCSVEDRD